MNVNMQIAFDSFKLTSEGRNEKKKLQNFRKKSAAASLLCTHFLM
jgi:hypothetical protein